jgi:hypothetical protein
MKTNGLVKLVAGALLLHAFPALNNIGAHAFPVANDAQLDNAELDSHCQGLSFSGSRYWYLNEARSHNRLTFYRIITPNRSLMPLQAPLYDDQTYAESPAPPRRKAYWTKAAWR